jgi:transcriptional regulator with XRE-family HTH domain
MTNTSTLSMDKLAEIIYNKRLFLELTQSDVQEQTGINRLMIGRIEKGEYLPSLPQLNKLAKVLEFSINDLIDDSDEQGVSVAMRGTARNEDEAIGIERLFSMMGFIKSQAILRRKLANE